MGRGWLLLTAVFFCLAGCGFLRPQFDPLPTPLLPPADVAPADVAPAPLPTRISPPSLSPPQVNIVSRPAAAGVLQPAYFDFEVAGREIESVMVSGGRYEENGRRRLLLVERLDPGLRFSADDAQPAAWRDGVYEGFFIWEMTGAYLADSAGSGDFVTLWPAAGDDALFGVPGRFRRAAAAEFAAAELMFDGDRRTLLYVLSAGDATPMQPQPGDVFQPDLLFLHDDYTLLRQPGAALTFDEAAQLALTQRALPHGRYFFGLEAENAAGAQGRALAALTVENDAGDETAVAGSAVYLDPYFGFQFRYPQTWDRPAYSGALLRAAARDADTQLQIAVLPDLGAGVDAAALQAQTMQQLGDVQVLFRDEALPAGQPALRTAYGYERAGGEARTGIFFVFVVQGTGFVVDVDGPRAEEAATVTAVDRLIASWQFRTTGFGRQPGRWERVDAGAFSVARPAEFAFQTFNAWQRFSSGRYTFIALQTLPAARTPQQAIAALVQDTGAGIDGFAAETPFPLALGEALWQRVDFTYTAGDGTPIWGFVMVKTAGGQEVVAWAEAPAGAYNELESAVFLTMLADLALWE